MNNNFEILEKIVLTVLLVCVFIAIGQEIVTMIENAKVTLADILLLFIYIAVSYTHLTLPTICSV